MTSASNAVAPDDAPFVLDSLVMHARVSPAGRRFIATVDALELPDTDGNPQLLAAAHLGLEGAGNTPNAAANALVQTMQNWLERQDTAGALPETLGLAGVIDDETEIVLHFANPADAAGSQ